jgi:hypothetical protein
LESEEQNEHGQGRRDSNLFSGKGRHAHSPSS